MHISLDKPYLGNIRIFVLMLFVKSSMNRTKKIAILLTVVVITGTIIGLYFSFKSNDNKGVQLSREEYPVCGIDISAHNGIIDFYALKHDSIDFVMIKATEGVSFKDSKFLDNYHKARKAGLKVGAYHFFRFETDGLMQALNFINSVKDISLDLPLMLDVEEWRNTKGDTKSIVSRLSSMINHLVSNGYNIILYSNKDGFNRFIHNRFDKYPLWICSFSNPPIDAQWTFWQHTHWGKVKGIYGNVDINTFNGSRQQWEEWLANHPVKAQ